MDVKEILNWYIDAGVDVICGDETISVKKSAAPAEKVQMPMSDAAQMGMMACKNARQLCEKAQSLEELEQFVDNFDGCALKATAKKTVFGDGDKKAKILLVGEAPGADEDREGKPFVGRSGMLLNKMLAAVGIERKDCYVTNILMWRPPGNRTPTTAEVAVSLPFLKRKIELINPEVIVALGAPAANALMDMEEPISKIRGKWFEYAPSIGNKIALLPTFHPAYLLRNPAQKAKSWADLIRLSKKLSNS